jgi:aspartyl aminopeptidase
VIDLDSASMLCVNSHTKTSVSGWELVSVRKYMFFLGCKLTRFYPCTIKEDYLVENLPNVSRVADVTNWNCLMQKDEFNQGLLNFLDLCPTPFHVVEVMTMMLESAGFQALTEGQEWDLQTGERYYVTRNGSSIVAFSGFSNDVTDKGVRLFGAHTDSPCLKIKPQPDLQRKGYLQLGVEVYGGALLNPWFDRDLSIAGRVTFVDSNGQVASKLVDWQKPVAVIPSLAIHLDREVNQNKSVNPQTQMSAIIMLADSELQISFNELLCEQIKEHYEGIDISRVLDYELSLYDHQPATLLGIDNEFVASARLDNLLSCYVGLQAMVANSNEYPALLVCNDHEEVGSVSACGADGPFLKSVLLRLAGNESRLQQALHYSLMFSADNAHALHPNYSEKHDENHGPVINQGPVIKVNMNQRYATNSVTSACYKQLSEQTGEPFQVFVVRSDMACGSTIGPITAAKLGIKTIDVGVPQWAMHSIRETCGSNDSFSLYRVTLAFLNSATLPE